MCRFAPGGPGADFGFKNISAFFIGQAVQAVGQRLCAHRAVVVRQDQMAFAVSAAQIERQPVVVDQPLDVVEMMGDITAGFGHFQDDAQRLLPVLALPRVAPEFRFLHSHLFIMGSKDLRFGKQYLTKSLLRASAAAIR